MDPMTLFLLAIGGLGLFVIAKDKAASSTTAATTNSQAVTATNPQGLYGINSGIIGPSLSGGVGHYNTVSNYPALVAAMPELGNVNHVFTQADATQYYANYLDLRQVIPTWEGNLSGGLTLANAQYHWSVSGGCAQKRIFIPLVPPSNVPGAAPAPKSSSSTSWIGPALQVAGIVVSAVAGTNDSNNTYGLNDTEINCLITGAAVLNDILPFYEAKQPAKVTAATNRLNTLLVQYV
jgi:hypothetical protein